MNPVTEALIEGWLWFCETGAAWAIWALPAGAVCWAAYRGTIRWLDQQPPPAWHWRDDLDPADVDDMALNAAQHAADLAALEAVGPAAIETHPAPADHISRALDALYYADAHEARKEPGQ